MHSGRTAGVKRMRPAGEPAQDRRPGAAVGHVYLGATDVPAAAEWFEAAGLRPIAGGGDFAVLELRG